MSEQEPMVKFYMTGEMRQSEFANLVASIGSRMLEGVRFGQGELDVSADMERDELKQTVTLQAARNFYLHLFQDDKPSPIAAVVVKEIARELPETAWVRNKKDEFIGITRSAWDNVTSKIFSGESKIRYRPGTKKRSFLEAFNAYLPNVELQSS